MNSISSSMLSQTLNLIQIARETAQIQGPNTQLDSLKPVENQLREIVVQDRTSDFENKSSEPGGILSQYDFSTLLETIKSKNSSFDTINSISDRNRVISAMSSGGMNDLDIARYFGISRDEVNIVLNLQKKKDITAGGNL